MAEIPRRIDFHYLKHPEYRSYHADGAGRLPNTERWNTHYILPRTVANSSENDA